MASVLTTTDGRRASSSGCTVLHAPASRILPGQWIAHVLGLRSARVVR